jgi:glycyl-tRNA synthetase beta subunit
VQDLEGGQYVVAVKRDPGQPAAQVMAERLPSLVAALKFDKTMRWNRTNVAFSRPIRWLVALLGDAVIPLQYAGVSSRRTTVGTRGDGSPEISLKSSADYVQTMRDRHILVDIENAAPPSKSRSARRSIMAKSLCPPAGRGDEHGRAAHGAAGPLSRTVSGVAA